MKSLITLSLLSSAAQAFPWVPQVHGVDDSMLGRRQQVGVGPGSAQTCPFNPNHVNAPEVTAQFPYNNAKFGGPGNGRGGYQVPAPGDDVHKYIAPKSTDIRGPCPGLNVAANHGFIARDGVTTFAELVNAQQNIYNVGYDLSLLLAFLGLQADGDLVTTKLSIGCDATTRTSISPLLTGSQPGLAGHNKFEGDTSLTRNDFFTGGGDNYSFNRTLFDMMSRSTGGNFNRENLAVYRRERYEQSLAENSNFFFGPLALLLFGAASFLYELMPSETNGYKPDQSTMNSFFIEEKLPENWTNRVTPYSNVDVVREILAMYLEAPVLFGGNTAQGNFLTIDFNAIKDGKLDIEAEGPALTCLLYQLALGNVPSTLNGVVTPTVEVLSFLLTKVSPEFANLGCARPVTK